MKILKYRVRYVQSYTIDFVGFGLNSLDGDKSEYDWEFPWVDSCEIHSLNGFNWIKRCQNLMRKGWPRHAVKEHRIWAKAQVLIPYCPYNSWRRAGRCNPWKICIIVPYVSQESVWCPKTKRSYLFICFLFI